jgi:CubicO group peptidase (beta-lactamase class C family)
MPFAFIGKNTVSRINTRQSRVTVDNWQEPGNLPWSFLHMDELFANAPIRAAATDSASPLQRAAPGDPVGLRCVAVRLPDGSDSTVRQILAATSTDAWMVLHGNEVLVEEYFGAMGPDTRHVLMSVSKSIVSAVVGVLAGQGKIDTAQAIEHYVPELRASGYRGPAAAAMFDAISERLLASNER